MFAAHVLIYTLLIFGNFVLSVLPKPTKPRIKENDHLLSRVQRPRSISSQTGSHHSQKKILTARAFGEFSRRHSQNHEPLSAVNGPFFSTPNTLKSRATSSYTQYTGDGTTAAGWPDQSAWSSFEDLWSANAPLMLCSQFSQVDNSPDETSSIKTAIVSVSASTGVDNRFILAVIMQESSGCVRAPTTNGGVRNPGLMQDHDGKGTCNDAGVVQNPCPDDEIELMIQEGTGGTDAGDGLQQCLDQASSDDVSRFYKAARIYNSGSVDPSGDLGAGGATHCYASDIANRLLGYTGQSACTLD
ncbi:MAG: hypothetical protein LQ351_002103 [Letrouitia transgressa]|nr:MAG: hypothetical protein LQ351_002103 [Letrouitia transgressa]